MLRSKAARQQRQRAANAGRAGARATGMRPSSTAVEAGGPMAGGGPRPRAAPVVDGEREFPQEAVSPTPPAPGGTAAPGQVEEFDVDPMLDNFRASLGRG